MVIFILSLSAYTERCSNALLKTTAEITDSTLITISLPKKTYKMYEPIQLHYKWINLKTKPDSIWGLFEMPQLILHYITDEKGESYTYSRYTPDVAYKSPRYIIAKDDTLQKAVILNDFGITHKNLPSGSYFSTMGYFPPGKYKIRAKIEGDITGLYPVPIKTNTVEFEVTENTDEDENILKLVKEEKYSEALERYPKNYFKEHIMYCDIGKYRIEFMRAGEDNDRYKDSSVLPLKYINFFDKYPNSLYNLGDLFIIGYLRVSSKDTAEMHIKMNELLNRYPGTSISITVNEIIKRESLWGRGVFIKGYHYKESMGKSKEVNPKPPVEK